MASKMAATASARATSPNTTHRSPRPSSRHSTLARAALPNPVRTPQLASPKLRYQIFFPNPPLKPLPSLLIPPLRASLKMCMRSSRRQLRPCRKCSRTLQERSFSDDEESLVKSGSTLSLEDCVCQGKWMGRPNSLNITKNSFAPYLPPISSTLPLASACATFVAYKDATLSPTNLPPGMKSVVTLLSPTVYKMAAVFLQHI